jgi:integral membrane sensor domain MASE1
MSSTLFSRQFNWEMSSAPRGQAAARESAVCRAPAALTAVAYYAGSRIGFALTLHNTPIAIFWPANAILLAALLLCRIRHWWIYWLALFPAHLLAQR